MFIIYSFLLLFCSVFGTGWVDGIDEDKDEEGNGYLMVLRRDAQPEQESTQAGPSCWTTEYLPN